MMKRKIILSLLCGVLLVGMTGCNSSSENPETNDNTNNNEETKTITSENYGDEYDYSVTVNDVTIDDWKIFYQDDDGIYIITSSYLPVEAIGTEEDSNSIYSKASVRKRGEKYGMFFSQSNLSYQEPNEDVMNKYFKLLELDSTHGSNQVTSFMLHSENWESLVNKELGAEYALGAAPVEMFVASWNEKYPDEKLYLSAVEAGYAIGSTENPTTYEVDLSSMAGYNDQLYFPTKALIEEGSTKVSGYHLASPSWCEKPTYGKCSLIQNVYETSGKIDGAYHWAYGYALRPIVFIPNK